ncbi:MAG: carbonic anhydrase family protein [Myxococcales bacterium]|nr:carbonic anhydrase family protein [Myxococcales bacterium]
MRLTVRSAWLIAALATTGCGKSAEHPDGAASASAAAGSAAPHGSGKPGGSAAPHGSGNPSGSATPHGSASPDGSASPAGSSEPHAKTGHAHWTYGGSEGPSFWGDLDPAWATCKTGKEQSPVDFSTRAPAKKAAPAAAVAPAPKGAEAAVKPIKGAEAAVKPIKGAEAAVKPIKPAMLGTKVSVDYLPIALVIQNNGHTVLVENRANNYITIGDKRFELLQFHMHSPSEHTVQGKHSELEIHFVHKSADGQLAVIGVMFDKGEPNPVLTELWAKLPKTVSSEPAAVKSKPVDMASLISLAEGFWHYTGSLTTPPCSEGVLFFIQKKTLSIGEKEIERYRALFGGRTNRPLQPLGDRRVQDLLP